MLIMVFLTHENKAYINIFFSNSFSFNAFAAKGFSRAAVAVFPHTLEALPLIN